eukprot:756641_1
MAELDRKHPKLTNRNSMETTVLDWDNRYAGIFSSTPKFRVFCEFPYTIRHNLSISQDGLKMSIIVVHDDYTCDVEIPDVHCDALCRLHSDKVSEKKYILHENCLTSLNSDGSMNVDNPHNCTVSCGPLYHKSANISRRCGSDGYYELGGCEQNTCVERRIPGYKWCWD